MIIVLVTMCYCIPYHSVAFCIVETLWFTFALGIGIDFASVMDPVLAICPSVDCYAHIDHCFIVKGGNSKHDCSAEALVSIGAFVLNGVISTFLVVAIYFVSLCTCSHSCPSSLL